MKLKFDRRFFLKSSLATISLPVLESLNPLAMNYGYAAQVQNSKFCFLSFPIGNIYSEWNPVGTGTGFQIPTALASLAPYKSELILFKGLQHPGFRGYGTNSDEALRVTNGAIIGGHHWLSATFLTSNIPLISPVTNSISVDCRVANLLGQSRPTYIRPPDLYPYDEGYSKEYLVSYSWDSAGVKNTALDSPKQIYQNLFGICTQAANVSRYQRYTKSILDGATRDLAYLSSKASAADKLRLDQYTTSVRETEVKLQTMDSLTCAHPEYLLDQSQFPNMTDVYLDIMTLGLQSGKSRVFTYLMDQDISQRVFTWLGLKDGHHSLSHDPNGIINGDAIRKISTWYATQFAALLGKLQTAGILDTTVCFFGSNMTNRLPDEAHTTDNLPIIVAGGSNGIMKTGQGVDVGNAPLANLHLTLVRKAGGADATFGKANPDPKVWYYPGAERNPPNPLSTGIISAI